MPSVDVDTTLIAIRIASYGPTMAIGSTCPKCGTEHDYDVDLTATLGSVSMPDYSKTVELPDGLSVSLKPLTYAQISKSGNTVFEEEKLIQTLADPDLDAEVRKVKYTEHISKMVELNIETITNCTAAITTEDGNVVTDTKFIREYYTNSESTVLRTIQQTIEELAKAISIKPVDVVCTECSNEFKLAIDFDYASFFARGF
jgi:bacterioferritin-associated ferredoxin